MSGTTLSQATPFKCSLAPNTPANWWEKRAIAAARKIARPSAICWATATACARSLPSFTITKRSSPTSVIISQPARIVISATAAPRLFGDSMCDRIMVRTKRSENTHIGETDAIDSRAMPSLNDIGQIRSGSPQSAACLRLAGPSTSGGRNCRPAENRALGGLPYGLLGATHTDQRMRSEWLDGHLVPDLLSQKQQIWPGSAVRPQHAGRVSAG